MKTSRNFKNNFKNNNSYRDKRSKKQLLKEDFYPNHYNQGVMLDCMNELGRMIKNPQYKKKEKNKITKRIQRLRFMAQLPYDPRHYYMMFEKLF